jgi:putative flippase GtrA
MDKKINLERERTRFAKFLVVGTIGAVVDFGLFNLLTRVFGLWALIAQVVSFLAAVTSNFLFNRNWTYPDSRSKPILRQAIQFAAVNAVGLVVVRTPLIAVLIPFWTGFFDRYPLGLPFSSQQLAENSSLASAVIVVLIWNFVVNRLWTYNDVD